MSRTAMVLSASFALALASCASPKKGGDSCCDSPPAKSDCCSTGAASKSDCSSCDSHAKKK